MSKVAKIVMTLVGVGGAALVVVAYWTGRGSTDAQEPLVIPFLILWTVLALALVWLVDRFVAVIRRSSNPPT